MGGGGRVNGYKNLTPLVWLIIYSHKRPVCTVSITKCSQISAWYHQPVVWRFPAGWLLVHSHQSHLKTTRTLADVWQACKTSHNKSRPSSLWLYLVVEVIVQWCSYLMVMNLWNWTGVPLGTVLVNPVTYNRFFGSHEGSRDHPGILKCCSLSDWPQVCRLHSSCHSKTYPCKCSDLRCY